MKYLRLFTVFALHSTLFAQGIKFAEPHTAAEWDSVKTLAVNSNRVIFVDCYTAWCGPCRWMVREIFPNDTVGRFYNENFICAKIDMEKGIGIGIAKQYNIQSYPTLLYIDQKGTVMHRSVGARNAAELISLGEDALNPEKCMDGFTRKYKSGERDPKFIREYLKMLHDGGMETDEIADWYFAFINGEKLLTKENYEMIELFVRSSYHPVFPFLLANREKFYAFADKKSIEEIIIRAYDAALDEAYSYEHKNGSYVAVFKDEKKFHNAIREIQSSGFERSEELILSANASYYLAKNEMEKYVQSMTSYINKYKMNDWQKLNEVAWNFYENEKITGKAALEQALAWVNKSVEIDGNSYNYDTKAAILCKLGNKAEAITAAEKAIQLAEKTNADASATKELLEKIKKMK